MFVRMLNFAFYFFLTPKELSILYYTLVYWLNKKNYTLYSFKIQYQTVFWFSSVYRTHDLVSSHTTYPLKICYYSTKTMNNLTDTCITFNFLFKHSVIHQSVIPHTKHTLQNHRQSYFNSFSITSKTNSCDNIV